MNGILVERLVELMKSYPPKIRKIPKKTLEWIESKVESPKERLLSMALAKNITSIRVYELMKRLKRV